MAFPRGGVVAKLAATLLSALLFLSLFYVPVVGSLLNPFAPLPLMYSFFRYGQAAMLISVAASAALVGSVAGVNTAVFYALGYGLMALVLARMIHRDASVSAAVAAASASALVATAAFLLAALPSPFSEFYEVAVRALHQFVMDAVETYKKAGVPAEQVEFLTQNVDDIARWVIRITPGMAAIGFLFMGITNYAAYRGMQRRWTYLKPADPADFALWAPPDQTVFGFIAGLGLALLPNDAARIAGINIMMVVVAVYFTAGFCVIRYWFEKMRVPKFLRMMLYILVLLHPFIIASVAGTGLFDLWFDFRKIRRKDGMKEENNGTDT